MILSYIDFLHKYEDDVRGDRESFRSFILQPFIQERSNISKQENIKDSVGCWTEVSLVQNRMWYNSTIPKQHDSRRILLRIILENVLQFLLFVSVCEFLWGLDQGAFCPFLRNSKVNKILNNLLKLRIYSSKIKVPLFLYCHYVCLYVCIHHRYSLHRLS